MMKLKPGVRLLGIRPEVVVALIVARDVYASQGVDMVVTSVVDGTHKRASEHYSGCAADLRVHDLPDPERAALEIQGALGGDYDVILERVGTPCAHIHLEFQPKLAY